MTTFSSRARRSGLTLQQRQQAEDAARSGRRVLIADAAGQVVLEPDGKGGFTERTVECGPKLQSIYDKPILDRDWE